MKLAIMQPYLFPYIGYFQLINSVDKFVILDNVNFIVKGYIHQNTIQNNGEKIRITFPVSNKSQNRNINEHFFLISKKSKYEFLANISKAYNKAPNFDPVFLLISEIIDFSDHNVANFNTNLLFRITKFLEINSHFVKSSEYFEQETLKGQDRILNICKTENASLYINPIGGINLYSKNLFNSSKIELKFLQTNSIFYKQNTKEFISNLSIIDLMMYCSKVEIKELLTKYDLI
jgi:hypothetical protein